MSHILSGSIVFTNSAIVLFCTLWVKEYNTVSFNDEMAPENLLCRFMYMYTA